MRSRREISEPVTNQISKPIVLLTVLLWGIITTTLLYIVYTMAVEAVEAQESHLVHPVVAMLEQVYGKARKSLQGDLVFCPEGTVSFRPISIGVLTSLKFHLGETITAGDPETVVMTKILLSVALTQIDVFGTLKVSNTSWYRERVSIDLLTDRMKSDLYDLALETDMKAPLYQGFLDSIGEWERSGNFI